MRYALNLAAAGEGRDPASMAELATLAEQAGWHALLLEDYVVYEGTPAPPTYDVWVTLAAMAGATDRLLLGTDVTPVPRQRPWRLASQAATLDHLTGGRVILGTGAGDVRDPGFGAVGEPVDRGVRAGRLDEGLAVMAALWTGKPVHHEGRHYRLDGLQLAATPVQQPRIPIWIGGDWLLPGVRRRVAQWDGCCVSTATSEVGERPLSPRQVRDVLRLVHETRGNTIGFDVCVGGQRRADDWNHERDQVHAVAEAGATWWCEWLPPTSLAETRDWVTRGPLRAD